MHHATGATVFSAAALQQGFEFESHPVLFCANLGSFLQFPLPHIKTKPTPGLFPVRSFDHITH